MGLGMMLLFANKFVTESHRSSHNITAVPVQILMGATKIGGKLSQKSIMPDVMLELCEVDVVPYHSQPEKYPFLQNIITELCGEQDITYRLASELAKVGIVSMAILARGLNFPNVKDRVFLSPSYARMNLQDGNWNRPVSYSTKGMWVLPLSPTCLHRYLQTSSIQSHVW